MKPSNIQARTLPPAPQGAERNASLEVKNFYSDSYPQIREKYRDGRYIVSLWSTTCAPCFEELEMLGQWRVHHPNVPIVLIAADDPEQKLEATEVLQRFHLAGADNWIFADTFKEKLRYSIDPTWRGEMPRAYLVSPDSIQVVKGLLKEEVLDDWLKVAD